MEGILEELGEGVHNVAALELGGLDEGSQDREGLGPSGRSVTPADFACDDLWPNGAFGPVIGSFDSRLS